jgi:5-methylcytosine-specific restriction endonuclease McrA
MLKTCIQCSITFTKRADSPGIFCSKSCNAKYHNARRIKKIKPTLECLHCKTTILPPNKFCGHSCSASYSNAHRTYKPSKTPPISRCCPQCNIKYFGKTKFCSRQCGWNSKRTTTSAEECLELKRARNRESYRRYIARRKYQTPVGEDIKAIRQYYINCPKGYEVDHIIPVSKGGSHSLGNLQYLTKEENRRKSNKIL